jgi:hypothetical protein
MSRGRFTAENAEKRIGLRIAELKRGGVIKQCRGARLCALRAIPAEPVPDPIGEQESRSPGLFPPFRNGGNLFLSLDERGRFLVRSQSATNSESQKRNFFIYWEALMARRTVTQELIAPKAIRSETVKPSTHVS